jgi:uncharacterized membrane protein YfcA
MDVAVAVVVGLLGGLFGGMLGVGGGFLFVPGMVLLLSVDQHTAQGVSLAVIALTALLGAVTHYRQRTLRLGVVLWIAPAAALFGFLGSMVADGIDASSLRRVFGVTTIAIGIFMLAGGWPRWWRWVRGTKNSS